MRNKDVLCVKRDDRRSNEIPELCAIDRRNRERSDCCATNVYILKGLVQGTSSASIVSGGSTGVAAAP
jgi:hypothetical protein